MRIYTNKGKGFTQLFKKYFFNINKKKLIKKVFIFFLISTPVGLIFIPIDLLNSRIKPIKYSGIVISKAIGSIDKKNEALAIDIFNMGDNLFGLGYRYLKSFTNNQNELKLNLSFKNYSKLSKLRNEAIEKGILVRTKRDKVNGYILYGEQKYPIRLRLKGDWTDHLLGEKWSFRVETKKNKAFLGMREFSLQHPRTRNYINEFILHELLKYEKLPYLRYQFVPLSLNGKYLGIYALEEHFGKELIENSKFREGPIFKISDKDKRNEWNRNSKIIKDGIFQNVSENNADILTFNLEKTANKKEIISQFKLGSKLLNEFLKKNIKTADIFDVSNTAKYFAITDLLQAHNANTWYDMRFYFDPISTRLIPIGYDAQIPYRIKNRMLSLDQNLMNLFDDPYFIKEYIKELDRLTKDGYIEQFLQTIDSKLKKQILGLSKSFPFVTFNKDELLKNRFYIRNRLFRLKPIGVESINFSKEDNIISLELFNKNKLPLNVLSIFVNGVKFNEISYNYLSGEKNYKRVKNQILSFSLDDKELERKGNLTLEDFLENSGKNNNLYNLIIHYKVDGINLKKSIELKIFRNTDMTSNLDPLITRKPTHFDFKNLIVDETKKRINIKKDFIINKPLILPNEYKLIIDPGVNIQIVDKGLIVVQGALIMKGSELQKININSINGGKGISVINSLSPSYINYSEFKSLKNNSSNSINITGGLSFYNSRVEIKNSKFIDSFSEDALNLVRSPFLIKNTNFINTTSDAIDLDFSNGQIIDSFFENIGNDAVDISGSNVLLNNLKIISSRDKGISVGERSKVYSQNIFIDNAYIGIASKDLSSIFLKNLEVSNVDFCLAAYEKKREYGPGFIKLDKSSSNCKSKYILESGSSISFLGYPLIPNTDSAYEELYYEK